MKIGLGINLFNNQTLSPPSVYSFEYQSILNKASSISATQPSDFEKALQNTLVLNLQAKGIWSKLDAFYMFANNPVSGGSYDGRSFALINWIKPTANYGTANPLPTFPPISAIGGFTGNGTNGIDLNFPANAGTNFKNPNGSFGLFFGTVSIVASGLMGASGNSTPPISRIRNSTTATSNYISRSNISTTYASNTFVHLNVKAASPSAGTGTMTVYKNGTGTNGTYVAWGADDTASFNILRYADLASFGLSQIKVAFIGGDLSGGTIPADFSDLLNNYINQLPEVIGYASYSTMASTLGYTIL